MDVNKVKQLDNIYKHPNLLLMITSSLFIIPVFLNYLTEHESFKKNRHEMILLTTLNIFSIMRWGYPCYITCLLDKILAHTTYFYYSIVGYLIYKKNKNKLFYFIMINLSLIILFFSGTIIRIKGFRYWYIIHALFHIDTVSFLVFFYYKNKLY